MIARANGYENERKKKRRRLDTYHTGVTNNCGVGVVVAAAVVIAVGVVGGISIGSLVAVFECRSRILLKSSSPKMKIF